MGFLTHTIIFYISCAAAAQSASPYQPYSSSPPIRTANNQSLTEITAIPSAVAKGGLVLLETATASGDATISFTSGIDSTYDEYIEWWFPC